jgi:hypothetical protein
VALSGKYGKVDIPNIGDEGEYEIESVITGDI